jgi:hypothetical protein
MNSPTVAHELAITTADENRLAIFSRVSTMTMGQNTLANLHRIVDARLWGLMSVVWHAVLRMQQGSITVTSGSLSSRPRPGTAMLTAMLSAARGDLPLARHAGA